MRTEDPLSDEACNKVFYESRLYYIRYLPFFRAGWQECARRAKEKLFCIALDKTAVEDELAQLKSNRWAAFTTEELLTMPYKDEITAELKRRGEFE